MIDLSSIIEDVRLHAAECAPRECCGVAVVISGKLRYWRCGNDSHGNDLFCINSIDYANAEDQGEIAAIVHSHVGISPRPSNADLVGVERSGLPWLIVNHPVGTHTVTEPSGYKEPLLGRKWVHGVMDCYTLAQDYYEQKLGILLPDFDREQLWWEKPGQSLYLDNFKKAGFFEISESDLREHDGILMMSGADRPNHGAIYIGNNLIMQHVMGRLSSRDPWGGYWRRNATHFLRHESLA